MLGANLCQAASTSCPIDKHFLLTLLKIWISFYTNYTVCKTATQVKAVCLLWRDYLSRLEDFNTCSRARLVIYLRQLVLNLWTRYIYCHYRHWISLSVTFLKLIRKIWVIPTKTFIFSILYNGVPSVPIARCLLIYSSGVK